jgi:hypothetical protein
MPALACSEYGGSVIALLRILLRIPPPRITRNQAAEIARAECLRLGKPWDEPITIADRLRQYVVWTSADSIGGNINVFIDIHSGAVTAVRGPFPR